MSGYRLRHATMRGGMGLVQDPRPLEPYFCPRCAAVNERMAMHSFKTHHIDIDSEGYCIVSKRVWERLQGLPGHGGFLKVNDVSNPPEQRVDGGISIDGKQVAPTIAGAVLIEGA